MRRQSPLYFQLPINLVLWSDQFGELSDEAQNLYVHLLAYQGELWPEAQDGRFDLSDRNLKTLTRYKRRRPDREALLAELERAGLVELVSNPQQKSGVPGETCTRSARNPDPTYGVQLKNRSENSTRRFPLNSSHPNLKEKTPVGHSDQEQKAEAERQNGQKAVGGEGLEKPEKAEPESGDGSQIFAEFMREKRWGTHAGERKP